MTSSRKKKKTRTIADQRAAARGLLQKETDPEDPKTRVHTPNAGHPRDILKLHCETKNAGNGDGA